MSELRWTLLILGVLFIIVLAWWEWRRPRHSSQAGSERLTPTVDGAPEPHSTRVHREPTLTLPEVRPHEIPRELPVVEIPEETLADMRATEEPVASGSNGEQGMDSGTVEHEFVAAPELVDDPAPASNAEAAPAPEAVSEAVPEPVAVAPEAGDEVAPAEAVEPVTPEPVTPIVEWPPEEVRRIVALRLVAGSPERLPGRTVRLALAAEGFVHGRYSIFHKPGPGGRATISVASLNKPGTFDPQSMDAQRFSGLNLFTVLPGPLPAEQAFDELLAAARGLNDRLQGALQDERGEPLTPARAASLRQSLAAVAGTTESSP